MSNMAGGGGAHTHYYLGSKVGEGQIVTEVR